MNSSTLITSYGFVDERAAPPSRLVLTRVDVRVFSRRLHGYG
ncbi:MAG: hypothetical protein K0R68_2598 [Mycobacterium sp.]|nr:hypothetical protein [Mycobacterium sp.]